MSEPEPSRGDFGAFYRRTLAPLRRYIARILHDRTEAQDVAHDAYSRVYRTMGEKEVRQPQGLLYTTARNLAINQLRRRGIGPVRAEDNVIELATSNAPGVESIVMARQEWAATEAAINHLPLGCRAVLLLCRFEGLTHREAAERLGLSPKTVEKQYARALRLLRASLQQDEIVPPGRRAAHSS